MSRTTSFPHVQLSYYPIFFLPLFIHAHSQVNVKEQAVLLNLKQHWENPLALSHWTPSKSLSHCSWPEIKCTKGSVTQIFLQNMSIYGTVPPNICDLKNLATIDLSHNFMVSQEFPSTLYNCSRLQYLDLSRNYLAGTVSDDIHRMSRLRKLNLGVNDFSGNIPSSIGRLTKLRVLQLHQCSFAGSFPPEIGNLSNLQVLVLAHNMRMTQTVLPSSFTMLKKLKFLWMSSSNLIGKIPDTVGEMAALKLLDLCKNSLSGKIPDNLFMLKNLKTVYLCKNKLTGEIPRVVEALNINAIDFSNNDLTGTIPDDFGRLSKLSRLSLFYNQLSGPIPKGIGNLPRLIIFNLFNNNFSGTLPPNLGRYSALEEFQVAYNMLTGKLPGHLCDNGRLTSLVASDNNLRGKLPRSLGNCPTLRVVHVQNNRFNGYVPSRLWRSRNLTDLILNNNSFTGELPAMLSLSLLQLKLNNNKFTGKIPVRMSSWKNLQVLEASNNLFTGPIPRELTSLPSLTTLKLAQNRLSGSLPSAILSSKSLNILNLSRNEISGQIPTVFGFLPGLTDLDLSENQLLGGIPPQLAFLRLISLNLSSNYLIGRVPRVFENEAYASSFLNNSGLCTDSPSLSIASCNPKHKSLGKKLKQGLASIIIEVIAALLVSTASYLGIKFFKAIRHRSALEWKLITFQELNFTVSDILSGLTDDNLIGNGGSGKVFRVANRPSRDIVAVKKIWSNKKLEQKLVKQFLAEAKILGTIRHSNIAKLLCCISSSHSKLLVYEYLENHSLDQWLHKKTGASTVSGSATHFILDWPKRMRIAIGAAQGLSFMHHDCLPPIVHRGMKSSNILLDSQFSAKIGDFGLAKMLMNQGESANMSTMVGSFGYNTPESIQTSQINEKSDVYSFGVILLELTTGKKATDGDNHTSLAEWAWRHIREGNPVDDALDEEVKELHYLDEMRCVFKLGVLCTCMFPSERPTMKEVLKILLLWNQLQIF